MLEERKMHRGRQNSPSRVVETEVFTLKASCQRIIENFETFGSFEKLNPYDRLAEKSDKNEEKEF